MSKMEGMPKPPQQSVEQQPSVLPPETMKKVNAFNQAMRVWDSFEKGKLATVFVEHGMEEAVIDALEFLKGHNLRKYTPEQEVEQFEKVDAYIKQLKGGVTKAVQEAVDIQPKRARKAV